MLHMAAKKEEWIEVFKKLVGMGLDPMELDEKQRTSLDVAVAYENEKVLSLFEREQGMERCTSTWQQEADELQS